MPEEEKQERPAEIQKDDKYSVVHSDEQTNVEDPKALARAHRKLMVLGIIATVALVAAVFLFIKGLETPTENGETEETETTSSSPVDDLTGQSTYYSFIENNELATEFYNLDTQSKVFEKIPIEKLVSKNSDYRNHIWQRSADGRTVVYQSGTSAGITNNNSAKDNKLVVVINSEARNLLEGAAVNEIADWILAPNGNKVYVSKTDQKYWGSSSAEESFYKDGKLDLYEIDVASGTETLLEKDYSPNVNTNEVSPLYYAKNRSLHMVTFDSGNNLKHFHYDLEHGESIIRNGNFSKKLTGSGYVELGPMSPDGTQLVLMSDRLMYLVSLNSNTLRTFYGVPTGYQGLLGTAIAWAPTSQEVAFTIAKSSRGEHKLITAETGKNKQITVLTNPPDIDPNPNNNHNVEVLAYSNDGDYISVSSNSKIYRVNKDNAEVKEVLEIPRNIKGPNSSAWIKSGAQGN